MSRRVFVKSIHESEFCYIMNHLKLEPTIDTMEDNENQMSSLHKQAHSWRVPVLPGGPKNNKSSVHVAFSTDPMVEISVVRVQRTVDFVSL